VFVIEMSSSLSGAKVYTSQRTLLQNFRTSPPTASLEPKLEWSRRARGRAGPTSDDMAEKAAVCIQNAVRS
jgi:hypothetical protein